MPGCLGTSERNCPEDKNNQGSEKQDSEYIKQYMGQPKDQANAQWEDQRKSYGDNMREKSYSPAVRWISIPHLFDLLSEAMCCSLSLISFVFANMY
jgi:hypothetical protein